MQLLDDRQPARAHGSLEPTIIAQLNLRRQQLLDRVRGRERAAIDALQDDVERFERARHFQVGQDLAQAVASREGRALHATPPVSWA